MNHQPLHILLADDDDEDRFLFNEALRKLEIKTLLHTVNDGAQLMEWLNKEDTALPHLLFLDLNMPRMNGLECLKEIRSNDRLKLIPIAIYSTSSNERDVEDTYRNGANVYIQKPDRFNKLVQVLQKAVSTTYSDQYPILNRANFVMKMAFFQE